MKPNDEFTNIAQSIVPGEQDMAAMDALARRWAGHPEERASYFAAHPEARRRGKWVMVLLAVALLLGLLAWAKVLVDTVGQHPGDAGAWFEGIFRGLMAMALVVFCVFVFPLYPLAKWVSAQEKRESEGP